MLSDSCSESISVLSQPSDDDIQVDKLDAIGIYIHVLLELLMRNTQHDHTPLGENPVLSSEASAWKPDVHSHANLIPGPSYIAPKVKQPTGV